MTRWLSVALFVVAGVVLVVLELLPRVPRLGAVLGSVLRYRAARVAAYLIWIWVGWHFFAR
jgi:hypothetical protein